MSDDYNDSNFNKAVDYVIDHYRQAEQGVRNNKRRRWFTSQQTDYAAVEKLLTTESEDMADVKWHQRQSQGGTTPPVLRKIVGVQQRTSVLLTYRAAVRDAYLATDDNQPRDGVDFLRYRVASTTVQRYKLLALRESTGRMLSNN